MLSFRAFLPTFIVVCCSIPISDLHAQGSFDRSWTAARSALLYCSKNTNDSHANFSVSRQDYTIDELRSGADLSVKKKARSIFRKVSKRFRAKRRSAANATRSTRSRKALRRSRSELKRIRSFKADCRSHSVGAAIGRFVRSAAEQCHDRFGDPNKDKVIDSRDVELFQVMLDAGERTGSFHYRCDLDIKAGPTEADLSILKAIIAENNGPAPEPSDPEPSDPEPNPTEPEPLDPAVPCHENFGDANRDHKIDGGDLAIFQDLIARGERTGNHRFRCDRSIKAGPTLLDLAALNEILEEGSSSPGSPAQPPADGPLQLDFSDAPTKYQIGTSQTFPFTILGSDSAAKDMVVQSWYKTGSQLVSEFAHTIPVDSGELPSGKLDLLPVGDHEIQFLVRFSDGSPILKFTHDLTVISSTGGPTPPVTPTPGGGDDPDPGSGNPDPGPSDPGHDPTDPKSPLPSVDVCDPQTPGSNAIQLPAGASTGTIQSALDSGRDVLFKRGAVYELSSTLRLRTWGQYIGAYGSGKRPVIIAAHDENAFEDGSNHLKDITIEGLYIYGATRDESNDDYFISRPSDKYGIYFKLTSQDGQFHENIVIRDNKVTHFDSNIKLVDDYSRIEGKREAERLGLPDPNGDDRVPGIPGRIQACVSNNILAFAVTDGSHAVGIYTEGTRDTVIDGNFIYFNGHLPYRNKKAHGGYFQSFNGPTVVKNNIFFRNAAHGFQLRAGGDVIENFLYANALTFFTSYYGGHVANNVTMRTENLEPLQDKYGNIKYNDNGKMTDPGWRGHGFQAWGLKDHLTLRNNVAAHRGEGTLDKPGFSISAWSGLTSENNRSYNFNNGAGTGLEINGTNYGDNGISDYDEGRGVRFVDPTRDVRSYMSSIGEESSEGAFIAKLLFRPAGNIDPRFTAKAINDYIREGYQKR